MPTSDGPSLKDNIQAASINNHTNFYKNFVAELNEPRALLPMTAQLSVHSILLQSLFASQSSSFFP